MNDKPKPKNLIDIMKALTLEALLNLVFILVALEPVSVKKENGIVEEAIKLTVEVAKGKSSGLFSRMRITVKIVGGTIKVTEQMLEDNDYTVMFENLSISYIDGKNVYFKADNYEVEED